MEFFIGILGLLFSILAFFGIRIKLRERISWKKVMKAVKKLDPDIRKYAPDVIIGLADGMIVAGIISTNISLLKNTISCFSPYYTLGVNVKYDEAEKKCTELLGKEVIPNLSGKKILIVDNHIYTGTTLKETIDFVTTKDPLEIKSLVLFNHEVEEKVYNPNFSAFSIKGKRHKVPWSYSKSHEAVYRT